MKKINQPLSKSLREQAEEILQLRLPITALPQTEAETLKLIHELQIRQIELELQNKELLQAQEQKAAYDNDQKYRYMFASNPQPMWIYDLETLSFLEVNDAAIHHYGYSKEEFLAMTLKDIRPKEDIERLLKDVELTRKSYNPAGEWRHLKKNGEIIVVDIISHTITFNDRKARHVMVTDITERKKQEEKLFESEFRFRKLWEEGPFGIMMVNQEFQYENVNPAFCKMLGYSETELQHLTFKDISHPEDLVTDVPNVRNLINKEISVYKTEKRYIRKDGQVIWGALTVTANYDNDGQFIYNLAIVEDVTRRKLAEEDLKKSKKLLSETESIGKVGGWEFNIDTKKQTWTDEVYRIHEVDLNFNPNVDNGINFYSPASQPIIEAAVQRVIESGEAFDLELEIITAKGNLKKVHTVGKPDPENHRVYGFFQDITERKLAEAALRESEKLFSRAFRSSPVAITITNRNNGKFIEVNNAWSSINGFTAKEAIGYTPAELNIIDAETRQKIIDEIKTKDSLNNIELSLKSKTGNYHTVLFSSENIEIAGEPCVLSTGIDITDRKLAEEKLRLSEEKFSSAFHVGPAGLTITRIADGKFIDVNDSFLRMFEFERDEVIGHTSIEINMLNPESRAKLIKTQLETGGLVNCELISQSKFGKTINLLFSSKPIVLMGEACHVTTMIDITERKQAEEAMKENNSRLELAMQSANMAWWEMNIATGQVIFDKRKAEMLGYPPEKFNHYKDFMALVHPEDTEKSMDAMRMHIDGLADKYEVEYRILTQSGEYKWFYDIGIVKKDNNGKPLMATGLVIDITKRKLQEEQLFESEFRFSKLYENGPFGMVMADKEFRFKKANPAFCEIMGYTEVELQQLTFKDVSHPDDIPKDMVNVRKLMNKEISVYKTEKRYVRKDGKVIWGALTVTPMYDSEGQFLYYLGIIEDISRRKHVEIDLKKSKELLSETESIGKVGGWEFNIDTWEQTWTDEVYVIHEVEPDFNPNVNKGINFYAPSSQPIIEKAVQRVIEFGEPFDLELEIISAKGNIKKVHTIGKPALELRRVYGFFQDITERKQAEEALREREYLLSSSQQAAHVGTWSWKVGDATTYWSDETYRIYGLSPEMGPPDFEFFFEIIHPEDRNKMREWPEAVIAGLHPSPVEFRVLRPDGIYRVIRTEGDVVDTIDGVPSRIAGTAYDITERIQAEEEIRQLNERISTATRSARVGIWDWDVVNNLLVWDDQMYLLYGLKKEEFTGAYEAWVSGLHHEDRQFSEEETSLALQGVKAYDSEFRVVWPDGSVRYLKAKGEVFRDDEGNPIRMLGVNFDITDRKQAEENIRQLNDELEQRVLDRTAQLEAANKELEAFSYSVSHDLRAPLRHINGFVDLFNEKYTDLLPEKGQHYLSVIHDASRQMGNLIDDLLQFSRTGRQEMQQMNLDMNVILQEVMQFYDRETKNRNIEWDIAVMPTIKGDLSLLRMVWFNLIGNAVKFTRERDSAQIKIGYTDDKKEIIFYIRDNGAGFDMRYVHKLFGVFQRLHSKQQFEGTGIGLANVQRIIKRHDGRVWAESELNKGATFYFTIPKIEENKK